MLDPICGLVLVALVMVERRGTEHGEDSFLGEEFPVVERVVLEAKLTLLA